jgi:hypothetical protein
VCRTVLQFRDTAYEYEAEEVAIEDDSTATIRDGVLVAAASHKAVRSTF